jgi:hypothetical protein
VASRFSAYVAAERRSWSTAHVVFHDDVLHCFLAERGRRELGT